MDKKIKEHYEKEAKEYGNSKQFSMRDINIKDIEVKKIKEVISIIKSYLKGTDILEVGCGNGYTAEQIINEIDIESITGIDTCKKLIDIANKRKLKKAIFKENDILELREQNSFDIVLSERCLINFSTWENQKKAINNIHRLLKKGGIFIMIEGFSDSLQNLNDARNSIGLGSIPQASHNLNFDRIKFLEYIDDKFIEFSEPLSYLEDCKNFLSSYYFGSRVIYPALLKNPEKIEYNNKFIEFFRDIPAYGNYATINMYILEKR